MTDPDHTPEAPRLERDLHVSSRLAEFTSVNALTAATGHGPDDWPLVIVKELTDNGTDNAEGTGIAPVVSITVNKDGITVTDNGSGIDPDDVARITDYSNRTSSTEAYASPTRGRQGNALQTLMAIPFALSEEHGETIIETRGVKHVIVFQIDPIRRTPAISHIQARGFVQNGTRIRIGWPVSARSELEAAKPQFVQMIEDYAALNPHLTLSLDWHGRKLVSVKATDPTWSKWLPSDPLSAHWYNAERFDRLIAARIAHDQDHGRETLVREFISGTFRGMTRKRLTEGCPRCCGRLAHVVGNPVQGGQATQPTQGLAGSDETDQAHRTWRHRPCPSGEHQRRVRRRSGQPRLPQDRRRH